MTNKIITEEMAIKDFNKRLEAASSAKRKDVILIGKDAVTFDEIPKHIRAKDDIGKIIIFAEKLFLASEGIRENEISNAREASDSRKRGTIETDGGLMVVLRPTDYTTPNLNNYLYWIEEKIIKKMRQGEFKLELEAKDLFGPKATRREVLDACNNPNFIYFTSFSHGDAFFLGGQNMRPIFWAGDQETKKISRKHHFYFASCTYGSIGGMWMAECGATGVHGYVLPLAVNLSSKETAEPFAEAITSVDKELLNGNSHLMAHRKCKEEFRNQAKRLQQENPLNLDIVLLHYDSWIKCRWGNGLASLTKPFLPTMHVKNVEMSTQSQQVWWIKKIRGKAIVSVVDEQSKPVQDVTVTGFWSGNATNRSSGVTKTNGEAELISDWSWGRFGSFTFTVENIKKRGWEYKPEENEETSGNIDIRRS